MITLFDDPWLLVLINGILAATLMHLVPTIVGLALGDRLALFQRTLCRLSLVIAIPVAITAALSVGDRVDMWDSPCRLTIDLPIITVGGNLERALGLASARRETLDGSDRHPNRRQYGTASR